MWVVDLQVKVKLAQSLDLIKKYYYIYRKQNNKWKQQNKF